MHSAGATAGDNIWPWGLLPLLIYFVNLHVDFHRQPGSNIGPRHWMHPAGSTEPVFESKDPAKRHIDLQPVGEVLFLPGKYQIWLAGWRLAANPGGR